MTYRSIALSGVLILSTVGAQAQSIPVASPVAVMPVMVSATAQPVLRNGTPVPLRLLDRLTTEGKVLRAGDRFRLETTAAVTVGGQIVIPVGTPAVGEITQVRNKGMWGRSGQLTGRILYLVANGRQIRMSGQLGDKGKAGTAGVIASVALAGLASGFLVTGTSAELASGTAVSGFIDEDVAFAPVPAAPASPLTMAVAAAPKVAVVAAAAVVPAPAPIAPVARPVAMAAAFTPPARPADFTPAAMPIQARRYAQRDEYIRLTGQMGMSPVAAMETVERKYGIPLE